MAEILKLPMTQRGRYLLMTTVSICRGWKMPFGHSVAAFDWDAVAQKADPAFDDPEELRRAILHAPSSGGAA